MDHIDLYPVLKQVEEAAQRNTLRFLVNINDSLMDHLAGFEVAFQGKKVPEYACFYPNHPTHHFLQINNYSGPASHQVYKVEVCTEIDAKAFKYQIASLRKLYNNTDKNHEWTRNLFLDQNTKLKLQTNVYKNCSSDAQTFLKHTGLNPTQQRIINCLHNVKNGIVLITEPAGTRKIKVLKFAV